MRMDAIRCASAGRATRTSRQRRTGGPSALLQPADAIPPRPDRGDRAASRDRGSKTTGFLDTAYRSMADLRYVAAILNGLRAMGLVSVLDEIARW